MNDRQYKKVMREARKLGEEAGRNAASWTIDGNTNTECAKRMVKGFDDGDPMILDGFNAPNLSGEWAGDPTPQSLTEELGIEDEPEVIDDACTAWEEGVSDTFYSEIERLYRQAIA